MKAKETSKVAIRYAKALIEACPVDQHSALQAALNNLANAWNSSIELRNVLLNPAFALSQRIAVLTDLAQFVSASVELRNFLSILLENNRVSALPVVAAEFEKLVFELQKTLSVKIISAYELSEAERSQILEQISKTQSGKPVINWHIDSSLIGGLIIKVGDKVLDNTVKGAIDRMRQVLVSI